MGRVVKELPTAGQGKLPLKGVDPVPVIPQTMELGLDHARTQMRGEDRWRKRAGVSPLGDGVENQDSAALGELLSEATHIVNKGMYVWCFDGGPSEDAHSSVNQDILHLIATHNSYRVHGLEEERPAFLATHGFKTLDNGELVDHEERSIVVTPHAIRVEPEPAPSVK